MVSYDASDPNVLAQIRAQAKKLERDLKGTITTKSGTFGIGKGVATGNVKGFDLDEYKRQVKAAASGTQLRKQATGNVFREENKDVQNLIRDLQRNKSSPLTPVEIRTPVIMENISQVKGSSPPPPLNEPTPMIKQSTDNALPYSITEPTIAHSELASAVSVPSENLRQIGQALPHNYLYNDDSDFTEQDTVDYVLHSNDVDVVDDTNYISDDTIYEE